jgi:anti-sigma B factor antagonist
MLDKQGFMPGDRLALPRTVVPEVADRGGRPNVRARTVDGVTIVEIVNAETLFAEEHIADLAAQLRRLVEAGHSRMVLDFRGVRSVSSDVLGTLAGLHRRLEKLGGRLSLCGADPVLRDMLRVCHLDRVFDINRDEDDDADSAPLRSDLTRSRFQVPASSRHEAISGS